MAPPSSYESLRLLGEYLVLHYGGEKELSHPALPVSGEIAATPFPVRCVRELLDTSLLPADASALEAGCAVGGASFELTRTCLSVTAGDLSRSFISAAEQLARQGSLPALRAVEGAASSPFTATVPAGLDRGRVRFAVQDAMALPEDLGTFDVLLAANLICRLPDPDVFLKRLPGLVRPGGQLLLTTPFTWLEEFTPAEKWIGGRAHGPSSEEELSRRLLPDFRLHRRVELPFLIREHERKYQLGIALGTSWIRTP